MLRVRHPLLNRVFRLTPRVLVNILPLNLILWKVWFALLFAAGRPLQQRADVNPIASRPPLVEALLTMKVTRQGG